MVDSTRNQHRYSEADGGFWIKADGSSIPIDFGTGPTHSDVFDSNFGRFRGCDYSAAFEAGWVRVSTHSESECNVQLGPKATLKALSSLRVILSHYQEHGTGRGRTITSGHFQNNGEGHDGLRRLGGFGEPPVDALAGLLRFTNEEIGNRMRAAIAARSVSEALSLAV